MAVQKPSYVGQKIIIWWFKKKNGTDRDMNYTGLVYVKETQYTATHHKGKSFYFCQKSDYKWIFTLLC